MIQNGDSPAGTNVKGALLMIAETVSEAVIPKPATVRKNWQYHHSILESTEHRWKNENCNQEY